MIPTMKLKDIFLYTPTAYHRHIQKPVLHLPPSHAPSDYSTNRTQYTPADSNADQSTQHQIPNTRHRCTAADTTSVPRTPHYLLHYRSEAVRDFIYALKYERDALSTQTAADLLATSIQHLLQTEGTGVECILCTIPQTPTRKKKEGYHQHAHGRHSHLQETDSTPPGTTTATPLATPRTQTEHPQQNSTTKKCNKRTHCTKNTARKRNLPHH